MAALEGRAAIVTGAGGGIGRHIALTLAKVGCDVGIFDRDEAGAVTTAEMVRALGRRAKAIAGSVAVRRDVAAAVGAFAEAFGKVDILVNNAGILRPAPFLETTEEDWRTTFAVNLDGAYHFCQEVLPHMVARKSGVIVNISSWTGKKGVPNHAAYGASKFALIGLTQTLAGEMGEHGIRVNAVCPGVIVDTGMRDVAERSYREQGLPDATIRVQTTVPLKRPGYPDDIANAVSFLCSDAASYVTGEAMNITGGLWMN